MIKIKTILVIFGGTSSEHEISLKSAASIIPMLDKEKYNVLQVGITKNGCWMLTFANPQQIENGSWENLHSNIYAILSPDRTNGGLILRRPLQTEILKVDCIWPILHGKWGEDGTIQGLFELAGIPYVGCNVCASALSMDKSRTKMVVGKSDIEQANYHLVYKHTYEENPNKEIQTIINYFKSTFPLFVKPCSAGSSVGVTKVTNLDELEPAIKGALIHDEKVLVEETIVGREVEVAVLGNKNPQASIVGEILSANEFYDYSAKYINSASRTIIPANILPEEQSRLQDAAITIYSLLECSGLSRVDFFLTKDGTPIFNEINTMPGFTNISMYPKLWEASGIPYSQLVDKLISLALEHNY